VRRMQLPFTAFHQSLHASVCASRYLAFSLAQHGTCLPSVHKVFHTRFEQLTPIVSAGQCNLSCRPWRPAQADMSD